MGVSKAWEETIGDIASARLNGKSNPTGKKIPGVLSRHAGAVGAALSQKKPEEIIDALVLLCENELKNRPYSMADVVKISRSYLIRNKAHIMHHAGLISSVKDYFRKYRGKLSGILNGGLETLENQLKSSGVFDGVYPKSIIGSAERFEFLVSLHESDLRDRGQMEEQNYLAYRAENPLE